MAEDEKPVEPVVELEAPIEKAIDIEPTHADCRICLETDELKNLIKPCGCTGTVMFSHGSCLKNWVSERACLKCEICGQSYEESLLEDLKPLAEAALQRREERRRAIQSLQSEEDEEDARFRRNKRVCRVLCVVFTFGALICLLLVLGMEASDAVWAAVLLRIVAFTLPLFLVFKATVACVEMRHYAQRMREIEAANQV